MERMRIAALFLCGCAASHTAVVTIPAVALPPLPPAEVVDDEPKPEPQPDTIALDDDDDVDDFTRVRVVQKSTLKCAPGSVAVGGACLAPKPNAGAVANGCTLVVNSIPFTHVLVDGVYVGTTPQTNLGRAAGSHTVMFVTDDATAKKVVTVTCAVGEKKMVVVRM